jgi:hypothetical protein
MNPHKMLFERNCNFSVSTNEKQLYLKDATLQVQKVIKETEKQ